VVVQINVGGIDETKTPMLKQGKTNIINHEKQDQSSFEHSHM
jgi:hypothetical protein